MTAGSSRTLGLLVSNDMAPRELIDLVQMAEAGGYSEFWYTDGRFRRDCYAGLAVLSQHTQKILLGPGVSDPFTRHPATIAMAIAAIDELSNGRAQLGLGTGGTGIAEMKLPKERPVRALREAIEIVRAMLTGETVRYNGQVLSLTNGKLGFTPFRTAIPIYVASHSPQILRVCGRLADGVLLGYTARSDAVAIVAEWIREGERKAGRPAGSVTLNLRLEVCVSDDEAAAMASVKRRVAARTVSTYPRWDYLARLGIELTSELHAAAAEKNTSRVVELLSDDDIRATALVGNAAAVTQQLSTLLTSDVGRVTIRPFPCQGQGIDDTVRAFAEQVWPAAQRLAGGST